MRKLSLLILLLALLGTTKQSFAGWPIGKYRNIFVPNFNYYHASNSWDATGKKINAEPGNGFDSYSMNLYFGYGLGRRWNLITTLPVVYQKSRFSNSNGSGGSEGYGPQDLQVGLDYTLVNMNYERFLSVQVSGIAPLYNVNSAHGNIGYGQGGAELKFSYCGNIPKRLVKGSYFNLEVFGRRYFGSEGPMQFTGYGLLGFNLSKRNQITVDAVYIKSISTNKDFSSNVVNIKDYELGKTSLNFGHSFTRRFSVFVGGFYTVYGRNTAEGYGGSLSTIIKL